MVRPILEEKKSAVLPKPKLHQQVKSFGFGIFDDEEEQFVPEENRKMPARRSDTNVDHSLFLHHDEDADAILSFFANDDNYEEEAFKAPVKMNKE